MLMPHVIRFNAEECAECYRPVAQAMGVDVSGMSDAQAAGAAADSIAALAAKLGLASKLSQVGVPEDGLGELAEMAMCDGSIVYNARAVMESDEVLAVYRAAF